MRKGLLILFVLASFISAAQAPADTSFQLLRIIRGDIVEFTVDNLDNVYTLNSRNQVKKYDANGDSVAVFNNIKKYGKATLIDVSNPLKVLLYYKDFATVVMLDRFLNVVNTIDLRKQNILQAKAIGQSYDNKIWIYDELENKLKKIDEDGKLMLETPDFRILLTQTPSPLKIYDENKFVYVYDSVLGVYCFDYYGALKNNIMIGHWQNFKVAGKFIFGSREDTLYRYDIKTFRVEDWKMPEEIRHSKAFNFSSSRLYALRSNCMNKDDCIMIYTIR